MNEPTVTITQKEYDRLVDCDLKLNCLENGGVKDWEWYDQALEDYYVSRDEDK